MMKKGYNNVMKNYKEKSKPFRQQLKEALDDAGMTQVELADRLGVRKQQVSDWINLDRIPRSKTIKELSNILGIKLVAPDPELKKNEKLYKNMSDNDLKCLKELSNDYQEFYANISHHLDELDDSTIIVKKINSWLLELAELKEISKRNKY